MDVHVVDKRMVLDFNVNSYVRVKLTTKGKAIHKQYWASYSLGHELARKEQPEYDEPDEDADGWCEFQLWELAHIFGIHMYNGGNVPFETIIQIII
jgi:Mn-dependent DtxR family transcriptional regulator